MFTKQEFIQSAYNLKQLPKRRLPEMILCGRSNVGKSSFINSLFNRKDLAKVSSTPGKTRSINFYEIDNKFYIVDLPGYGFAKTSKHEREHWSKLINAFISESGHIRLAIHFIDGRHQPTKLDLYLNNLLHTLKIPYIILLSKSDKLKQSEMISAKKALEEFIPGLDVRSQSVFYSSVKFMGRKEVTNLLKDIFY